MAGEITALIAQKRNKDRVNIYLDGEFAFGLAAIEAIKLRKGQKLTDDDVERLQELDDIETARQAALNYLSYRPRSIAEVRRNLRKNKRGFSDEAIDTVLERLEEVGLLSDEAFARFWVDNREQFKPRSIRALRYELRQKGVGDEAVENVLADLDEAQSAYRAAQSRMRRYERASEAVFRKKMTGYLAQRGFPYGIIRETIDQLWEELLSQAED